MKSISFEGVLGGGDLGDWTNVRKEDIIALIGQEEYDRQMAMEIDVQKDMANFHESMGREHNIKESAEFCMHQLAMCVVADALGIQKGKRYKFTIAVEEIPDASA